MVPVSPFWNSRLTASARKLKAAREKEKKVYEEHAMLIIAARRSGLSYSQIGSIIGVSRVRVMRIIERYSKEYDELR